MELTNIVKNVLKIGAVVYITGCMQVPEKTKPDYVAISNAKPLANYEYVVDIDRKGEYLQEAVAKDVFGLEFNLKTREGRAKFSAIKNHNESFSQTMDVICSVMVDKGRNPNLVYRGEFFTLKTDSTGNVGDVGRIQSFYEIVKLQKAREEINARK